MIEDDDIEIITPYVIQMQEKIKRLEMEKSELRTQLSNVQNEKNHQAQHIRNLNNELIKREKSLNDWRTQIESRMNKLQGDKTDHLLQQKTYRDKIEVLVKQIAQLTEMTEKLRSQNEQKDKLLHDEQQKLQGIIDLLKKQLQEQQNIIELKQTEIVNLKNEFEKEQQTLQENQTKLLLQEQSKFQEIINQLELRESTNKDNYEEKISSLSLENKQLQVQLNGLSETVQIDRLKIHEDNQRLLEEYKEKMLQNFKQKEEESKHRDYQYKQELEQLKQCNSKLKENLAMHQEKVQSQVTQIQSLTFDHDKLKGEHKLLLQNAEKAEKQIVKLQDENKQLKIQINKLDKKLADYTKQRDEYVRSNQATLQQLEFQRQESMKLNYQVQNLTDQLILKEKDSEQLRIELSKLQKVEALCQEQQHKINELEQEIQNFILHSKIVPKKEEINTRRKTIIQNDIEISETQIKNLKTKYKEDVKQLQDIIDTLTNGDLNQTFRNFIEIIIPKMKEFDIKQEKDDKLRAIFRDSIISEINKNLNILREGFKKQKITFKAEIIDNEVKEK